MEIGWGSVDWIQLTKDRDWWRALVNTVMNLRVLAPQLGKKGYQPHQQTELQPPPVTATERT
jgi:hypothetical protein